MAGDKRVAEQLYDEILVVLFQIKDPDVICRILDMVSKELQNLKPNP